MMHRMFKQMLIVVICVVCMAGGYFVQPSAAEANEYDYRFQNLITYNVDLYGDGTWEGAVKNRMLPKGTILKVSWFEIHTTDPAYFIDGTDGEGGEPGLFHPARSDKDGDGVGPDLILNPGLLHTRTYYDERVPGIDYYAYWFEFEVQDDIFMAAIDEQIDLFHERIDTGEGPVDYQFELNGHYGMDYLMLGEMNLGVDSIVPTFTVSAPVAGTEIDLNTDAFHLTANDPGNTIAPTPEIYYEWVTQAYYDRQVAGHVNFDWSQVNETDGAENDQPLPAGLESFPTNGNYHLLVRVEDAAGNRKTGQYGPYPVVVKPGIDIRVTPYMDDQPILGNRIQFDEASSQPVFKIEVDSASVIDSVYYNWSDIGDGTGWVDIGAPTVTKWVYDVPPVPGEKTLNVTVTPESGTSESIDYSFVHDGTAPEVNFTAYEERPYNLVGATYEVSTEDDDIYRVYESWSSDNDATHVTDWIEVNPRVVHDEVSAMFGSNIASETPDGEYYFHVKAVDEVGNIGLYTVKDEGGQPFNFVLDNTPPEMFINGEASTCFTSDPDGMGCTVDVETTPLHNVVKVLTSEDDLKSLQYKITSEPKLDDVESVDWYTEGWTELAEEPWEVPVTTSETAQYMIIWATDQAGNQNFLLSNGIIRDGEAGGELGYEYVFDYEIANPHESDQLITNGPTRIKLHYTEDGNPIDGPRTVNFELYDQFDVPVNLVSKEIVAWEYQPDGRYLATVDMDFTEEGALSQPLEHGQPYRLDIYLWDGYGNRVDSVDDLEWYFDNEAPESSVIYEPGPPEPTAGPVTATITYSDDDVISGTEVKRNREVILTDNTPAGGQIETVTDLAGNTTDVNLLVDWIVTDPNATVTYSPGSYTMHNVKATIAFPFEVHVADPAVKLIDADNHIYEYEFAENGSCQFAYSYGDDQEGQVSLHVDWIDRVKPEGDFIYTFNEENGSIVATLSPTDNRDGKVIRTQADGSAWPDEEMTHAFTENGEYPFYFKDAAGNPGSATAVVTIMDKTPPELEIRYSTAAVTNGTVRATVTSTEPIVVKNNGGKHYHDFGTNGSFSFTVRDRFFNETTVIATVGNIDEIPPNVDIQWSNTDEKTKEDVIATLISLNDEQFMVLNNNGRKQYRFTENGSFTFIVADRAGNIVEKTATVTNIDKSKVQYDLVYSTQEVTTGNVTVTVQPKDGKTLTYLNNGGSPSVTFSQNGIIWLLAKDDLDNSYYIEAAVTNIDKQPPVISYSGDLLMEVHGDLPDLTADVTVTDNYSVDLKDAIQVEHSIDVTKPGSYQVTYTVTDEAGHETSRSRNAIVVDNSTLSVFVNSQQFEDRQMIRTNTLAVQTFGELGEKEVHIAYGDLPISRFKSGRYLLDDATYEITKQGYYTIWVRDQELQQHRLLLYVIPQYREGN